jgi:predicted Na+-dependent transporter
LTGMIMQFIIMPCLGYVSIVIFHDQGLTYAQSITLLIVTSSPGGTFSNLWCSLFNADLPLSVAMTSFSSVLGIGFLPANIALYTNVARITGIVPMVNGNITKSVDFKSLATSLGLLIAGVALGLLASYKLGRRFRRVAHVIGSISGVILIALSAIFSALGSGGNSKPWNQKLGFYAGVGFPSIVGILITVLFSLLFCNHAKPDIMTIAVECAFQNIAIAASAAFNIFSTPNERAQALCVPVMYGGFAMFFTSVFCLIAWKLGWSKAPRNVPMMKMLRTSYEFDINEDIQDHMTLYAFFNHNLDSPRRDSNPFHRYKRKVRIPVISLPAEEPSSSVEVPDVKTGHTPPSITRVTLESPHMTGSSLDMTDYFFHFLADDNNAAENESLEEPTSVQQIDEENPTNVDTNQPDFIALDDEKDHNTVQRSTLCSPKSQMESNPKLYVRIDSDYHDEICNWLSDVTAILDHRKIM